MKKALIVRLGAYGDNIIISPVINKLKEEGYYIIFYTNKRGYYLYHADKRVDKIIQHQEDMPFDKLKDHWKEVRKEIKPHKFINFTGSLENNLALHPVQPLYVKPKYVRFEHCNKNYYDETMRWAGYADKEVLPEIHFTNVDLDTAQSYIKKDKFNVLWCLSGSGKQKVYPWTEYVMGSLVKQYPDFHIITVGDEKCKLLEFIDKNLPAEHFTELAGEIPITVAMALTKYVDLVISPDTGILHASGCFDTPKIGLLGHTTIENITKYFKNDYSLQADCACAPCFYLIYNYDVQCPVDVITQAAWCMAEGVKPERVYEQIKKVRRLYDNRKGNST